MGTFDRQRYQATEDHLWRETWLAEARVGRIWVPHSVGDTWARTLCMALHGLRGNEEVRLFVDCKGGEEDSFEPCRELWWRWQHRGEPDPTSSRSPYARKPPGLATISTVTGSASSIGLSYSVCATNRLAYPEARFIVHGESEIAGKKDESGVYREHHYIANWMARFTNRPYDWWLDLVSDGKAHEFGVAEALEWGVIDAVEEGV